MYTLFGAHIELSPSPKIHQNFAEQCNIDMQYSKTTVAEGGLALAIEKFRVSGGKGANVTYPLKHEAYTLCDVLSERAKQAKAVNTIYWNESGQLCGDNTDGVGFVRDISKHISLKGKNILLIGAGGAACGILGPILAENPSNITITNRTISKAKDLSNSFKSSLVSVACLDELSTPFDIVINATSASMSSQRLSLNHSIFKSSFVYDLAYGENNQTDFTETALKSGAKEAIGGMGMLVEQAAEAFYIWHGVRPDIETT